MTAEVRAVADERLDRLAGFVAASSRLFVLTGAGCSTESGIPDYRDASGAWKRRQPMTFQTFRRDEGARRRYWARSMRGWPAVAGARPNAAHRALADLERRGGMEILVTQNVDGLHQAAGSRRVIDLHGRLDRWTCLDCGGGGQRETLQTTLERDNPHARGNGTVAPDGDADIDDRAVRGFRVPGCGRCGGVIKPDVVFFGENVPKARVARVYAHLEAADAVLVVGSSLTVWSGYRFVRAAAASGLPVAAINIGRTRADDLLDLKVPSRAGVALERLLAGP